MVGPDPEKPADISRKTSSREMTEKLKEFHR